MLVVAEIGSFSYFLVVIIFFRPVLFKFRAICTGYWSVYWIFRAVVLTDFFTLA